MHTALGVLCNNRNNMFSPEAASYYSVRDPAFARAFSASNSGGIDLSTIKNLMLVSREVSILTYDEFITKEAIGVFDFREDLEVLKSKLRFILLKSIPVVAQLNIHNLVNYIEAFERDEYCDIIKAIVRYDIDLLGVGVKDYNKIKCWDRSSIREISINFTGFLFADNCKSEDINFNFKVAECLDKIEIFGDFIFATRLSKDRAPGDQNFYDVEIFLRSFKSTSELRSICINKVKSTSLSHPSLFCLAFKNNENSQVLCECELYISRVCIDICPRSDQDDDSFQLQQFLTKETKTVSFSDYLERSSEPQSVIEEGRPKLISPDATENRMSI